MNRPIPKRQSPIPFVEDLTVGTEATEENAEKVRQLLDDAPAIVIRMGAAEVFTMIGGLQLALRNPAFRERLPVAWDAMRYIVTRLIGTLPVEMLPAIAAGFDPKLNSSLTTDH